MSENSRPIKFPKALDLNGKEIHIMDAERGRKGYRCTGCKKEVEAVKPLRDKPRPYFRHAAKDVDVSKSECTYANETHRHKIAKEALQELKSIRVPRVIKLPPKGIQGDPKIISGPRTVVAYRVDIQKSFYLNNQGLLKYGPKTEETTIELDKHFLIVPDVIFFDRNDKPILFIELVATHGIDDIKLAKLKALEIDTVSVALPVESPEAIRECFNNTERTKWIYNNEREHSDYSKLPGHSFQRVSGIDKYEAGLSYESTRCRKSRLGNLIRAIGRCLEEDGFKSVEDGLKQEISAIDEELSKRERVESKIDFEVYNDFVSRRSFVQRKQAQLVRVRKGLQDRFEEQESSIEGELREQHLNRRRTIRTEEKRIEGLYQAVQRRYKTKGEVIEREEKDIDEHDRSDSDGERIWGRSFIEAHDRFEGEITGIEESIRRVGFNITTVQKQLESIQIDFDREGSEIERRSQLETDRNEIEFEEKTREEDVLFEELRTEEIEIPRRFEDARNEIDGRFQDRKRKLFDSIKRRDTEGNSDVSSEIKSVILTGRELSDRQRLLETAKRCEKALRFLNSEAFKIWIKSR